MLSERDIKKIRNIVIEEGKKVFVTKDELKEQLTGLVAAMRNEFATKNELAEFKEEMRGNFASVLGILDGMAKRLEEHVQEMKMLRMQVNRHERWHHEAADELDITLEY